MSVTYAPKEVAPNSVDAVVANVMDGQRIAGTDLLIDEQPQHLDQRPQHGLGPAVLPRVTGRMAVRSAGRWLRQHGGAG